MPYEIACRRVVFGLPCAAFRRRLSIGGNELGGDYAQSVVLGVQLAAAANSIRLISAALVGSSAEPVLIGLTRFTFHLGFSQL